ncbi:unnamed protein product [Fusarium graminearum]|uniref:Uncharacterized protein n=1 Tax=Gibberella zeae TaxID=5518 RepID=A0A9N8NF64_GIBZA|nr:unnamed protein product [Fusarium graminearum]
MPSLCAAYLRIIMGETSGSMVRIIAMSDLTSVVVYSMFDMSYEGDYMPFPENEELSLSEEEKARWAEKDAMELEAAIKSINQWHFTEDTEWAREMIISLVSGKELYRDLPSKVEDEDDTELDWPPRTMG